MKIAVASGKGGTGKTTVSTNLASYLSQKEKILLSDLDVEEPNAKLFFNANPCKSETKHKMIPQWTEQCSLCGLCKEVCEFNAIIQLDNKIIILPELCHSCNACAGLCPDYALKMIPVPIGVLTEYKNAELLIIESRLNIGQEQAVPLISQTKEYIRKNFKNIKIQIFDAPPGTSCPAIEAIKDVDLVFLVTEPTPFGLHDLRLAVETVKQLNKHCAVIINRSDNNADIIHKYCDEEEIEIIAEIPNERNAAELYSNGQLIYKNIESVKSELVKIETYIKNFLSNKDA